MLHLAWFHTQIFLAIPADRTYALLEAICYFADFVHTISGHRLKDDVNRPFGVNRAFSVRNRLG